MLTKVLVDIFCCKSCSQNFSIAHFQKNKISKTFPGPRFFSYFHDFPRLSKTCTNPDSWGPITWRLSAKAGISARFGGLKFQLGFLSKCMWFWDFDYMKNFSARPESSSPVRVNRAGNLSPAKRAENSHVIGDLCQPGLKISVCNKLWTAVLVLRL